YTSKRGQAAWPIPGNNLGTLEAQGRPVLEFHAQSQAACSQHFLDLVERLATQVGGLEQLVLGTLDEITNVIDVLSLEAVCRTHCEFEVVHRTQQDGIDLRLGASGGFVAFVRAFQSSEYRELVHQDAGSLTHRFFGRDHAIGGDIQHQLVEVSTLFNARAFHSIADATHGAVGRIESDPTDGVSTIVGQRTYVTRNVAATLFHLDLHFQLTGFGKCGNDVIGVDDFNVVRKVDVCSRDYAGTLTTQGQRDFFTIVQLEDNALEVQQDVDHVFPDARQRRVFVHHACDLYFSGRIARHRRQQNATQGITQRVAIAAFERLHDDLRVVLAHRFDFDGAWLQKTLRHDFSFTNPLGSLHR